MKASLPFLNTAALAGLFLLQQATPASAVVGIKITEWMYNSTGSVGEFVEFTNFGPTPIDFTGWSFDDSTRLAGSDLLSAFGTVASGESVLFTDAAAADFRASWGLGATVKIIGGNLDNLGRSDEINLYDNTSTLVDRLTFNDQGTGTVAGPRTNAISGRPASLAAVGANNASLWTLSTVGDVDGGHTAVAAGALTGGEVASPGSTSLVPEPATAMSALTGLVLLATRRRRSRV